MNDKFKETASSFFTFVFYVVLIIAFIGGEVHAFKKHNDGMAGVIFFPWGIYRGIESIWHDDYADVDWNKRLASDMRLCYYFITESSNKNISQVQFSDDMERLSSTINKYPKEKREYLSCGTRKSVEYTESTIKDVLSYMVMRCKSDKNIFAWSDKTNSLENELVKYGLKDEIETSKKGCEDANKNIESNLKSGKMTFDKATIENFEPLLSEAIERQKKESKKIFKVLFNSEL